MAVPVEPNNPLMVVLTNTGCTVDGMQLRQGVSWASGVGVHQRSRIVDVAKKVFHVEKPNRKVAESRDISHHAASRLLISSHPLITQDRTIFMMKTHSDHALGRYVESRMQITQPGWSRREND